MLHKKLIISAALIMAASGAYYLQSNLKTSENMLPVESSSTRSSQTPENPQTMLAARNNADEETQNEAELPQKSPAANESMEIAKPMQFLSSDAFSTPEAINKAFVRRDGVVERESLTQVFQHENFREVVNILREAGHDAISSNRETLLSQHLMTAVGSEVFQVDYSCSGDICAVILQSVDDISPESISNIAEFDTNYSFTSKTVSDLGETTVSAIYIAADDPSTLSITP